MAPMPRIFVSQAKLDDWMGAGQVAIEGEMLRIGAGSPVPLFINPAVHFQRIDGSAHDPYDIVGAVKSQQELAQMGADHYEASVVLGEYAYTVTPGFLAIALGQDGTEAQLDSGSWGQLLYALEQLGS